MLISDPDYLIHTLRLTYLRNVEDPFGARIITLNPQYNSNPYIRASGLGDKESWPEINEPSSPQPVVEESFDPMNFHGMDPGPSNGRSRHLGSPAEAPGMYPGATNLKYTQTIVGPGRGVGGAGMRVSGRRSSATRAGAASLITIDSKLQRIRSDSAPTPVSAATTPTIAVQDVFDSTPADSGAASGAPGKRRSSGGSTMLQNSVNPKTSDPSTQNSNGDSSTAPPPPPPKPTEGGANGEVVMPQMPAFAFRFARGAEMEERRRERMKARFNGAAARAQLTATEEEPHAGARRPNRQVTNESAIDESSDEDFGGGAKSEDPEAADGDESAESADDDDDDDALGDEGVGVEEDESDADEFLSAPYPLPPMMSTTTASDDTSILSSGVSASQSSAFGSSLRINQSIRARNRLSPVSEGHNERKDGLENGIDHLPLTNGKLVGPPAARRANKSYFSISPPERVNGPPASLTSPYTTTSSAPTLSEPISTTIVSPASAAQESPMATRSESIFSKSPIKQPPFKSSLSAMLSAKSAVSDNPFMTLYAAISGRAETSSMTLRVFFPHSPSASQEPVEMKVRKDATVEEVIGFGLWTYWDQGLDPKLDEGLGGDDDPKRAIKLSAVGWNFRIAEDDGEVDEDFPALDRTRPISKFAFDSFAICLATATQVEQNRTVESKIVRRPSRLMIAKKSRPDVPTTSNTGNLLPPSTIGGMPSSARTHSDVQMSSALGGAPSQSGVVVSTGPPVFLRVRVAATADMHYSTTINATAEEYMADVLDRVCRRRRIENPKEWALVTGDMRIVIPLDRTVASLAGKTDLVLVGSALLDHLGLSKDKRLGRSSDPNASIFKRMSEVPATQSALDFTASYKRFTVYRKMPVLVGRHERSLAIDGDYIHIMPAANRGLLDSVKTSSYHIKSVILCKQTKKGPPNSVQLVVWRDGGNKTYEFEAEDSKKAAEIVSSVRNLQNSYRDEKSGTVKQVGRRRAV